MPGKFLGNSKMKTREAEWLIKEMMRKVNNIRYERYSEEWPIGHTERPTYARWKLANQLEESVPPGHIPAVWRAENDPLPAPGVDL